MNEKGYFLTYASPMSARLRTITHVKDPRVVSSIVHGVISKRLSSAKIWVCVSWWIITVVGHVLSARQFYGPKRIRHNHDIRHETSHNICHVHVLLNWLQLHLGCISIRYM